MKRPFFAHALLGAAALLCQPSWAVDLVQQNQRITHAYVLLQAQMTDPATFFQRYAIPAEVEVVRYGGEALLGSNDRKVIEGQWAGNWTLILKFPSLQAIDNWYHSAGYQAVLPFRHQATAWGHMVAIEGLPESSLAWRVDRQDDFPARITLPNTLDTNPVYTVTAEVKDAQAGGFFVAQAGFSARDLSQSKLSVEIASSDGLAGQLMNLTVILRDAAGRRWPVVNKPWQAAGGSKWQTFQQALPEMNHGRGRNHFDMRQVQAIEIEWHALQSMPKGPHKIFIRNLSVTR